MFHLIYILRVSARLSDTLGKMCLGNAKGLGGPLGMFFSRDPSQKPFPLPTAPLACQPCLGRPRQKWQEKGLLGLWGKLPSFLPTCPLLPKSLYSEWRDPSGSGASGRRHFWAGSFPLEEEATGTTAAVPPSCALTAACIFSLRAKRLLQQLWE